MSRFLAFSLVFTALSGCSYDLGPLHGTGHRDTGIVGDGGVLGDSGPTAEDAGTDAFAGDSGSRLPDTGTLCCVPPGSSCGTSADCCGGISCSGGVCGALESESCLDTNDCSGDLICIGAFAHNPGTCQTRSADTNTLDCGREGHPCCEGAGVAQFQCEQGTVCAGTPGTSIVSCVPCGGLDQIKCSGVDPCQPGLAYDALSVCRTVSGSSC